MGAGACFRNAIFLLAGLLAPGLHAERGVLTFVFGPNSPEAARQAGRAAAATARHWLQTDGGTVELRRSGSPEVQRIDAAADAREFEQTFVSATLAARDADPPSFLLTLDAATQAAALQPGARVVVAVLNSPSFSSEGERTLQNLGQICQDHSVRVLVLDLAEDSKRTPGAALNVLVAKSGGAWVRQARDLGPQVAMVVTPLEESDTPSGKTASSPTAPAPSPAPPAAAPAALPSGAANGLPPFEIPVHVRFVRTSGTGATSESIIDREADFGATTTLSATPLSGAGSSGMGSGPALGGGGSMEVSYWPNDPHAPLQGLVTVESPLTAIRFEKDDTNNTYQGHARITAIIRDAKGAEIWTGGKDVSIHGPLPRLAARREGSMFFMRGVTVVGQGPFTLEAKVEDLIGNTSGTVQAPLRVGRNAPSLVATDAMAVRPFKRSGDMFESDQVLAYDGEALSPVLDPVFRADRPVDLQVYLRLYPDIHGSPLELSMEVQREGRVVARMALPFKGGLASSAREGASNGIGGSSNILGGQAKEFPYLVNMKGARFPPGDYQGIISIRQGTSVVRRVIHFQVTGNGAPAPVERTNVPAPSHSAEDAELAGLVLPEIEPATVDSSGLKMGEADQKQLWEAAAHNAMGYLGQLPNFRCIQETHRFTAPARSPDQLREADSYMHELIFEDGKERYQRLDANGEVDNAPTETKGVSSRNEFGSMLRGLFDPDVAASYRWAGRSMALGVLCQVFQFEVARSKSNFVLHAGNSVASAGYTGRVFIDEETGMVRRLTINGALPADFGLQSPSLSLDYGMVKIGDKDYLLPLRSVLQLRQAKVFVRNETVFRGYRKFDAESQIKFVK